MAIPVFNLSEKIDWHGFSRNPNAIHLLEKNLDNINWDALSQNPEAFHLLEKNLDKINKNERFIKDISRHRKKNETNIRQK